MARKKSTPPTSPDPEPRPLTEDEPAAIPQPQPQPKRVKATPPAPKTQDARPIRKSPKRGGALGRKPTPEELNAAAAAALVNRGRHSPDPKQRTALAREAIKLDPNCAEAFLLLGEEARTRKSALKQFGLAVGAAERALGPEIFRDGVGDFWLVTETRPYMRARAAWADALWASGEREAAVAHLVDLLRLNPGDNQGLRYVLAGWLLHLDRTDALVTLLDQYDEDSTAWLFSRVLVAFRREGDTPARSTNTS